MNLSVLGEDGFLDLVRDWISKPSGALVVGIGDDAALLDLGGDAHVVVSTDAYGEGVHFDRVRLRPEEIGHRVMAATLSDLAAMGATGKAAFVNLHAPKDTPVDFLQGVYRGLDRVADTYGVRIGGGDTVRSDTLAIGVTAIGTVPKGRAILRSGASGDETICVTGDLGRSEAGRLLLAGAIDDPDFPESVRREAEDAHRFPRPRFDAAEMLRGLEPVRPTAMMDVSDGLATDLRRLCAASRVGCLVEERRVPVNGAARRIARMRSEPETTLAFGGGEDFELLFTMKPGDVDILREAARSAGITVSVIGTTLPESGGLLVEHADGSRHEIPRAGWDHFLAPGAATRS